MTLQRTVITIAIVCVACSASPKINVGNEPDGSVAGSGGASGFGGVGGFGGGDDTLSALITEPPSEMAIDVITISCAGECKQVLAIASGGNDPYTFAWNDGVTTAAREICATDDTTFTVTVNDTAIVDGEFPYAGQTATASVTANVLTCASDGGVDATVPGDGGVGFCVSNPGFEGAPALGVGLAIGTTCAVTAPAVPTGFQNCDCTPDVLPTAGGPSLAAFEGATYLGGSALSTGGGETAATPLCAPLIVGARHAFSIQLAEAAFSFQGSYTFPGAQSPTLEIWGGLQGCERAELLWRSPAIANTNQWQKYCGAFTPSAAYTHLTFVPAEGSSPLSASGAYVVIDDLIPGDTCL